MSVSNLKAAHAFDDLPSGRPTSAELFDERSVLQVNVQHARMRVPAATTYRWSDHWRPPDAPSGRATHGCTARTLTGAVRLGIPLGPQGAQVEINFRPQGDTSPSVHTRILQGGHASIGSTWPLDARWDLGGRRFFVASTMHDGTLQVTLPAGQVAVCADGA